MVSKIGMLSASFVICGSLLFAYGFAVVYAIANDPIGASFDGPVPTYYYFENISGGTPLMSLGITITAAGLLVAFHNRHRIPSVLDRENRIILTVSALFGLVGGSMAFVSTLTAEIDIFSPPFLMILPMTLMLLFLPTGSYVELLLSYPVLLIPASIIFWSFIGLTIFGIVKMLRLGSGTPTLKS